MANTSSNVVRERDLGSFQVAVMAGLWRLGGGKLGEITRFVREVNGGVAETGAVHTTLLRLGVRGLVDRSEEGKEWRVSEKGKGAAREWLGEVEVLAEVVRGLVEGEELGL